MKKVIWAVAGCFFLFLGGLIYLFFRPRDILLFKWLDAVSFNHDVFLNTDIKLPVFFVNHLNNAFFVVFGYIIVYVIWKNDRYHYFLYTSIITFLCIVYEIITHDVLDIITILVTFIICSLFYNKYLWRKL